MTVGPVGIVRIPARRQVLDPEGVAAVDANSEPHVQAADGLVPPRLGGAQAADIVPASRRVEHGLVVKDEAEREESLRGDAVVVVPFPRSGDVAGRAVADAAEDRALERHRLSEPPLEGGAERGGRARDTEDLRRYVVIAAVKSPYPSIGVARFVFLSEEEAADHDVLEGVVCVADSQ